MNNPMQNDRKNMNKISLRPEISWSLMHPVELDADYMKKVIKEATAYRVDSFEICGECHNTYGGLDGLITYDNYPPISANIDIARIEKNRRNLRAVIEMAHESGQPVYYWHREIMIPSGLTQVIPELLDENGEFDLLGAAFAQLIAYKIKEALQAVPELDGLVLTLTEADYSVLHNSDLDRYPPEKIVAHIARTFARELGVRGKRFILRSFGANAQDNEAILAGAAEVAKEVSFEIETKITPYDFVPFLPPNPFLRKIPGTTLGAECDCLGEFLGAGYLPAANVERIVNYVREAQSKGVDRFTIRLDRIANTIFDSAYAINLFAYQRAIDDPSITAETIWQEWSKTHWPECPEEMAAIYAQGIKAVEKINFIHENLMFHMFPLDPSMKWVKAGGIFALFKENVSLKWQSGIWSIFSENTTPVTRAKILQEKDEAIELATNQLNQLNALKTRLPEGMFNQAHKEWRTAVEVAQLYRAFCQCVCAYFDDMENGRAQAPSLQQAIEQVAPLFARHLSNEEMKQTGAQQPQSEAIDHNAHTPRTNPLKNVYAIPLWAITKELQNEYVAERKAKTVWTQRNDISDSIIFGAITDEWRIWRNMHASHSMIHNGLPSRIIGNRVFPNGTVKFQLKAPNTPQAKLILHVDPNDAHSIWITINGTSHTVKLSSAEIIIPMTSGETDSILIEIGKSGPHYPRIYMAALSEA
jgi:hypothetical protein